MIRRPGQEQCASWYCLRIYAAPKFWVSTYIYTRMYGDPPFIFPLPDQLYLLFLPLQGILGYFLEDFVIIAHSNELGEQHVW